jgi:hypothetical protein
LFRRWRGLWEIILILTVTLAIIYHTVSPKPFAYHFEDDLDHQTATWTYGNFFTIPKVRDTDFKPVATRTRVVVDLKRRIVLHILDFDLIIDILCHLCSCLVAESSVGVRRKSHNHGRK